MQVAAESVETSHWFDFLVSCYQQRTYTIDIASEHTCSCLLRVCVHTLEAFMYLCTGCLVNGWCSSSGCGRTQAFISSFKSNQHLYRVTRSERERYGLDENSFCLSFSNLHTYSHDSYKHTDKCMSFLCS